MACPRCSDSSILETHIEPSFLVRVEMKKMGELYCCPQCNSSWYRREPSMVAKAYEASNQSIILLWAELDLRPTGQQLLLLKSVGVCNPFSDVVFCPVKATLKNGKLVNSAVICLSDEPPQSWFLNENHWMFWDEVAKVEKSEEAFSQEILKIMFGKGSAQDYVRLEDVETNELFGLLYGSSFLMPPILKWRTLQAVSNRDFQPLNDRHERTGKINWLVPGPESPVYIWADSITQ